MSVDSVIDENAAITNEGIILYMKEALRALILLGFLRHRQEGLNKEYRLGGTAILGCSPLGIIQCLLHPAIP